MKVTMYINLNYKINYDKRRIDVLKGKSTVCLFEQYEEIIHRTFEMQYVEKDLKNFYNLLQKSDGKIEL